MFIFVNILIQFLNQLKEQKFDFFPLNRALCLTAKDEDSTDSKIDELLKNVSMLINHQKSEVNSQNSGIFIKLIPVYIFRILKENDLKSS